MEPPVCPRCGHFIPHDDAPGAHPGAVSRHDNATEVCSVCGLDEAVRQFLGQQGGPGDGPLDRSAWWDVSGEDPGTLLTF